jgi:hypothetical protein
MSYRWRNAWRMIREWARDWAPFFACFLAGSLLFAAPAKRTPPKPRPAPPVPATAQEQQILFKLRDLIELVPRRETAEGTELYAKLKQIEELLAILERRLTAIEDALKKQTPDPPAAGVPR